MATRRRTQQGIAILVLWVIYIAALLWMIFFYDDRFTVHSNFPHLPFYGAVAWWFFFLIPVIGVTYGFFNDWKDEK